MKKCCRCKAIKPVEQFYKNKSKPDGHQYYCKLCAKEERKQDYEVHREKRIKKSMEYERTHRSKVRKTKHRYYKRYREKFLMLAQKYGKDNVEKIRVRNQRNNWKKYGLSEIQYNELFTTQKGSCAICRKHQSQLKHALNVDHNHKTGQVRGLLCPKCNTALAIVENEELAKKARQYLARYKLKLA